MTVVEIAIVAGSSCTVASIVAAAAVWAVKLIVKAEVSNLRSEIANMMSIVSQRYVTIEACRAIREDCPAHRLTKRDG